MQPSQPKFPRYDAEWRAGKEQISVMEERRFDQDAQTTSIVGVVQKTVNAARRADAKVNKLRKEQQEKKAKWKAYQAMMKEEYNKEENRFHRDQERLQEELASAVEEQSQAHALIAQAAVQMGEPETAMQTEAPSAWDELWSARPVQTDQSLSALGRELADYLRARAPEAGIATPVRPAVIPPRTPAPAGSNLGGASIATAGPHAAAASPTPSTASTGPPATGDPYVMAAATPPNSKEDARLLQELRHYMNQTTAAKPRQLRTREGSTPRQSVKQLPQEVAHPSSPGAATLSAKLEAQRIKLLEEAAQAAVVAERPGPSTVEDEAREARTTVLLDDDSDMNDSTGVDQLE